jgi:hypothetical protein
VGEDYARRKRKYRASPQRGRCPNPHDGSAHRSPSQSPLLRRCRLAAFLVLLAPVHRLSPPFFVTLRLGQQVIGPETALDLVLPAIDSRGNSSAASPRLAGDKLRVAEIWITLAASPAADRIASLARATADGHPVVGTCEIVVEPQGGAGRRTYVVGGCFAKSVDVADNARRVTLGYSTIRIL